MGILETPHDLRHFDAAKAAQASILSREPLEEWHFQMQLNYQQATGFRGQVKDFVGFEK